VRAQDVPSSHGWLWVKQGLDLFRKAPRMWLAMSVLWLVLFFATLLLMWPIGAAIVLVLYPAFVALWVRACQQIDGLEKLAIGPAFAALAPSVGKLVALGGLIVLVQTILTIIASNW